MAREIDHKFVRDLAKNLRERTGRDIKHTEIIEDIASALGERPDALMHSLKAEAAPRSKAKIPNATPDPLVVAVREAGFEVWQTGGGCSAWGRSLRTEKVVDGDEDDECELSILIATDDGSGHEGDLRAAVWSVGIDMTGPQGGETLENADDLTFAQALELAKGMASRADELWEANAYLCAPRTDRPFA